MAGGGRPGRGAAAHDPQAGDRGRLHDAYLPFVRGRHEDEASRREEGRLAVLGVQPLPGMQVDDAGGAGGGRAHGLSPSRGTTWSSASPSRAAFPRCSTGKPMRSPPGASPRRCPAGRGRGRCPRARDPTGLNPSMSAPSRRRGSRRACGRGRPRRVARGRCGRGRSGSRCRAYGMTLSSSLMRSPSCSEATFQTLVRSMAPYL